MSTCFCMLVTGFNPCMVPYILWENSQGEGQEYLPPLLSTAEYGPKIKTNQQTKTNQKLIPFGFSLYLDPILQKDFTTLD